MHLLPPSPTRRRAPTGSTGLRALVFVVVGLGLLLPAVAWAEPSLVDNAGPAAGKPVFEISVGQGSGNYATAIKIFLMVSALSLAPAVLLSVTSFTRIVVVLSLLRSAVGVQQLPPNKVLIGLALFLSLFTMAPVWTRIDANALTPYEAGTIDGREAATRALVPLREFMIAHTRKNDLELFIGLSGAQRPDAVEDVSTLTIVPSFMLSELKTAFQMGALLFLPFLIIDLLVASVLMSLGMMMLPPMVISMPLKLFIFVLADGWGLVLASLAKSVMQPIVGPVQ